MHDHMRKAIPTVSTRCGHYSPVRESTAWMQDDANTAYHFISILSRTVLWILPTSELKYASTKPATCPLCTRSTTVVRFSTHAKSATSQSNYFGEGAQNSVFTGYSSLCCQKPSGSSLQLVNDDNLRLATAWIMPGAVHPFPRTSSGFGEHRRYSAQCNTITLLYILTNGKSCSIPKSFSNPIQP